MKAKYLVLILLIGFASVEGAAQTQQPQPSLKDTLQWMQNSLDGNGNEHIAGEVRSVRVTDFSECRIHFTYTTTKDGRGTYRMDFSFNLADIDPAYVTFYQFPKGHIREGFGVFGAGVQNDAKKITIQGPPWADEPMSGISFDFDVAFGVRFTKAFKRAVTLCGGKASITAFDPSDPPSVQPARQAKQQSSSPSAPPRKDIPAIVKAANGAIVTIFVKAGDTRIEGTGFIVSPDGAIVTNYHVIKTGNLAAVKFPDGTILPVDGVLEADKDRDLAVIKIHGQTFKTLALGDSDRVQVGEEVVAIGDSLGLELTVSNGILSGVRTVEKEGGKFLQTTAPISHGNSGGPLLNMTGEVIGINTLFLGEGQNLNFAIPVNDAKRLLSIQSTKLQNLPNEAEPKEAPPKESPAPPSAGQDFDSPAYRQYQELLKANDFTIRTGIYACFYDSKERAKNFFVISANLLNKQAMQALVNNFTDGVLGDSPSIFGGKIQQFSSKQGIFADLPTSYDHKNSIDKSHETDVFKWISGDIAIEAGWGKLTPGQVRMGYRFKLQHSTGRFIEDTELNFPGADSGSNSTIHEPGRCVRIPNISMTPEEQYELVDN